MNAPQRWAIAVVVVLGVGAIAAVQEPKPQTQPLTPAQDRLERAAHDVCAEQYGPHAAHRWADGRLECFREVR